MAAQGSQPVSSQNLAAALGVERSGGIGSQPICVDNLKAALGEFGGTGDILFFSASGATSGTLAHPVEDYDLVLAVLKDQYKTDMYAAVCPPSAWAICGESASPYIYTQTTVAVNNDPYGTPGVSGEQQRTNATMLNMSGTTMGYSSFAIKLPVLLVVGIKDTGLIFD